MAHLLMMERGGVFMMSLKLLALSKVCPVKKEV